MGIQKIIIEATLPANKTDFKLWEQSCPTIVNRRLVEVRAGYMVAGKLALLRETDEVWAEEPSIKTEYQEPDVIDVAWPAGVTMYLYGTERSGSDQDIIVALFYEELPV